MVVTINRNNAIHLQPVYTVDLSTCVHPHTIREALIKALELDGFSRTDIDQVFNLVPEEKFGPQPQPENGDIFWIEKDCQGIHRNLNRQWLWDNKFQPPYDFSCSKSLQEQDLFLFPLYLKQKGKVVWNGNNWVVCGDGHPDRPVCTVFQLLSALEDLGIKTRKREQ